MKLQKEVMILGALLLAGCGGGGGGGSDSKRSAEEPPAVDLSGTWIQTNVNYFDPAVTKQWMKTRRQTIIVTGAGSTPTFTDCNTGGSLEASVTDNTVSFQGLPGVALTLSEDGNTISGTVVAAPNTETQVVLHKVSASTQEISADLDLTVDLGGEIGAVAVDHDQWTQVCISSIVDKLYGDTVDVKATGSEGAFSGSVALKFVSTAAFTTGVYNYPSEGNDISGSYTVSLFGSGNLSNPVGTMTLSDSTLTQDFSVDVVMSNTGAVASSMGVSGLLQLKYMWLFSE